MKKNSMHHSKIYSLLFLSFFALVLSCNSDDDPGGVISTVESLPKLSAEDLSVEEGDQDTTVTLTFNLDKASDKEVAINYTLVDGTASLGADFLVATDAKIVFAPNTTSQSLSITIIGDLIEEPTEIIEFLLFNPSNTLLVAERVKINIVDNDEPIVVKEVEIPTEGYDAASTYPGKSLVWEDDFSGTVINESDWTFEIGNGSGGWGNNELEFYRKENAFIQDGHLVIKAKEEMIGGFNYTSTRMKTQAKRSFKYGRIDIRAVVPEGQGIWPALWMLGEDIVSESWPACGEIDIMELVGHQPNKVHGTVHFGSDFSQHQYTGESYSLPNSEKYSEKFHVFSIDWEEDRIQFFMDDQKYFEFNATQTNGQPYPFNDDFFFLFNVAVGGNWPGSPNSSTVFPQYMIVDYIRVYQ